MNDPKRKFDADKIVWNLRSKHHPLTGCEFGHSCLEAIRKQLESAYAQGVADGKREENEACASVVEKGWLCNGCAVQAKDLASLIKSRLSEGSK